MSNDVGRLAQAIEDQNRLQRALLTLLTDSHLRSNPELGASRFSSVETLLSEGAGLKNVEIAQLLGKTPQAVGQALARKSKPRVGTAD